MADLIIHSDNFTDENGELHYFNTGRDNVSGLAFPRHYVKNEDNKFFTRILNIKLSRDTSIIYNIHETFLLTAFSVDNKTLGDTNIVNIDAVVKSGTITHNDIRVICSPLSIGDKIHDIKAAIKNETDENGFTTITLGIWLYTKDILNITVTNLSCLAFNEIPNNIYHEYLESNYESHYLNNEEVMHEVNMFNFEESIGVKIADSTHINKQFIDLIGNINPAPVTDKEYKYLSVIYDDLYSIKDINVDETINPTAFQYIQMDNSFAKINNDFVQVNEEGNYLIALKVNMDIHDGGSTKMMMSVFLNGDRLDELTSQIYLNPQVKEGPFGFLAGQIQVLLKPSDKLYLKARWSNKDNVAIENHSTLQITKLS